MGGAQSEAALAGFALWLKQRRGAQFASLHLKRYLPFLNELHRRWTEIPDYAVLVDHFSAEGLRRVRSVVLWLEQTGQLHIDPAVRELASERRRIAYLLEVFPVGLGREALLGYQRMLEQRLELGGLQLRSMRIALSSATRLLYSSDTGGQRLPDQKVLLLLLRKRPGLWASLYGFIGYLNRHHSTELTTWVDSGWLAKASQALMESRLLELYAQDGGDGAYERRWIAAALSYFHSLGRVGMNKFKYTPVQHIGHAGFSVFYRGGEYWVPAVSK